MRDLKPYSLKVSNYKCFGEEAQGFESIRPVNIIVGRNNVGKSTLLEVINHANIMMSLPEGLAHKGKIPGTTLSWLLTEDYVYNTLGEHLELRDELHDMQNRRLSEGRAFFKFSSHGYKFANYGAIRDGRLFESIDRNLFPRIISAFEQAIANPFAGYAYRRIAADRDIRPELDDHPYTDLKDESLSPNGEGATTIVERVLQNDQMLGMQHPASLIEQDLVRDLNLIYGPDAKFDGIEVKRRRNNSWEIFLEEKEKGLIALTQTGSGLKTVVLVLLNLIIFPQLVFKRPLNSFIYAFEELENNLHPAVQRRLFSFLRKKAVEEGCYFFLTTHSNVVIDLFGKDEEAQILHVTHDGTSARVQTISTYLHKRSVLQDLDVRASDILQSIAVVWVEGPSDRIYLNRWIELWDGELKEGIHYQCLYSAGGLVEGISFDDPEKDPEPASEQAIQELIEALKINRNSIVMMDRDRGEGEALKPWVSRIEDELNRMGGVPWVTAGRTVENYIPLEVAKALAEQHGYNMEADPGPYDNFFKFFVGPKKGDLSRYKTKIARQVSDRLGVEHLESTHDLPQKLELVCDRIREWNGMTTCPRRASTQSS